jgi:hypothetical protein
MKKYEDAGDYANPEYVNAEDVFDELLLPTSEWQDKTDSLSALWSLPNAEKHPKSQKVNHQTVCRRYV